MLDLMSGFISELRNAGLPVSLTENLDAMEAIKHIPLEEIAAYGAAAPYAIALVALAAVPAWLLSRAMTRTDVDTVDS